jgi:glycosyltransferase involved in cell wall biosynthesis
VTRTGEVRRVTVDVVIDNYNYGRFLRAAIDSALSQTHPSVHVIVVDDGSTDGSRDVIGGFGGEIDVVLKENGGQASALNAGFERGTGDVVIFLDADDLLLPDAAGVVAATFAADRDLAKVQYRLAVVDAEGRPTGGVKPPAHIPLRSGDLRPSELAFPFDLVTLATSGNAFSRRALGAILPIPERPFAHSADWYLVHLTPLLGTVRSLDCVCGCYRVHGANAYEPQGPELDLGHVRNTIEYTAATRREIERLADKLGLRRPRDILAVSDVANRLISLKLAPREHPLQDDRLARLAFDGIRAAARRFDVQWLMRVAFAVWATAVAVAPRRFVRVLAPPFLFHDRRPALNRLLRHLHRPEAARADGRAAP